MSYPCIGSFRNSNRLPIQYRFSNNVTQINTYMSFKAPVE